jgi:hypothetical protein
LGSNLSALSRSLYASVDTDFSTALNFQIICVHAFAMGFGMVRVTVHLLFMLEVPIMQLLGEVKDTIIYIELV